MEEPLVKKTVAANLFFDRDISWLSFNGRVLEEAGREGLPAGERINFLSIYSSNLDEFYRVRIPALMALHKMHKKQGMDAILEEIKGIIDRQQQTFGSILRDALIPLLRQHSIFLIYGQPLPEAIRSAATDYFYTQAAAFLHIAHLSGAATFFPENNKIYLAVALRRNEGKETVIINIPSEPLPRFYTVSQSGKQYIIFLDDIIRANLPHIFPDAEIESCNSFKITRDAELDLEDEYQGDIAERIERQMAKRDFGLATRLLYDADMPDQDLQLLVETLQLHTANKVKGGRYHNLKDLSSMPVTNSTLYYEKWIPVTEKMEEPLFERMTKGDFMLHTPYQNYDTVLRFFNEAVLDKDVSDIFITLYRIAGDSRIAQALISAAHNGKKVTVFVELKARFDEANNIRWAKKMKAAGVRIIYSIPGWKVHAKVALVKRKKGCREIYYGLLGTGNFNENTARLYTDHLLFTANKEILSELELLFIFLSRRKKEEGNRHHITFRHLLTAQFNLQSGFLSLIDAEIAEARMGRPAAIIIKLNNLEEETLISKLYEASAAGVQIQLIVRSICRLIPGVKGLSENISVRRIVDRYLEHGRIFIFHNGGKEKVYCGSADWMNRNIYRRIEVCFPIYETAIQQQLKEIIRLELADNTQAVLLNENLENIPVPGGSVPVQSQLEIYKNIQKQ